MSKSFYISIRPNYYFYKIFCSLSVSMNKNGFTTKFSNIIYSLVWIIVYGVLAKGAFPETDVTFMYENVLSQLRGSVEIIATISLVIINAITNLFTRHHIVLLFRTLEEVNTMLEDIGGKLTLRNSYLYFPLIFVMFEFAQVTLWDFIVFLKSESIMYIVMNYTTVLLNSSCRFAFIQIVCLICSYYHALNKSITNFLNSDILSVNQESKIAEAINFIKGAAETHARISNAIKLVNKIFGFVILLCIALAFFIMTSQLNECYITFAHPWDDEDENYLMSLLTAFNWASFQFVETAILVYACSKTMSEVYIVAYTYLLGNFFMNNGNVSISLFLESKNRDIASPDYVSNN